MKKVHVSDNVMVLAGKDRGKTGEVLKVNWKTNRVLIKGVNIVKKSIKPNQELPDGGIAEKEAFIHISNISILSGKDNTPSRIGVKEESGKKVRFSKKSGSIVK